MPAETMIIEEDENQFLLFLRNSFFKGFDLVFQYSLLATHYFFLPAVFVYSFWVYAFDQSWLIFKHVINEIKQLLRIIPLTVELWFWSCMIMLESVFVMKKVSEIGVEVEQRLYKRIQTILHILNALPLTPLHAASLHSVLNKLHIFGKALPFPNFLFEQTFKKIAFSKGAVRIVLPSTEGDPSTSGTEVTGSSEQIISTEDGNKDDSKSGVTKRQLSNKPGASDGKQSKVTDSSKNGTTESSVPSSADSVSI